MEEIPLDAACLRCGYGLPWNVIPGNRMLEQEAKKQGKGLWGKSTQGEYSSYVSEKPSFRLLVVYYSRMFS